MYDVDESGWGKKGMVIIEKNHGDYHKALEMFLEKKKCENLKKLAGNNFGAEKSLKNTKSGHIVLSFLFEATLKN